MTALDLDGIKARAEAATPGPWQEAGWDDSMFMSVGGVRAGLDGQVILYGCNCHVYAESRLRDEDAEFIAAARSDIPALVAEVEALREGWAQRDLIYDDLAAAIAERDALAARIEAAPVLLGDLEETQAALFRHVQKLAEEAVLLGSQIRRVRAALSPQEGSAT